MAITQLVRPYFQGFKSANAGSPSGGSGSGPQFKGVTVEKGQTPTTGDPSGTHVLRSVWSNGDAAFQLTPNGTVKLNVNGIDVPGVTCDIRPAPGCNSGELRFNLPEDTLRSMGLEHHPIVQALRNTRHFNVDGNNKLDLLNEQKQHIIKFGAIAASTPIDPANPPWGTSGLTVSTSGSDPIQVQVPNTSGGTGTPGTDSSSAPVTPGTGTSPTPQPIRPGNYSCGPESLTIGSDNVISGSAFDRKTNKFVEFKGRYVYAPNSPGDGWTGIRFYNLRTPDGSIPSSSLFKDLQNTLGYRNESGGSIALKFTNGNLVLRPNPNSSGGTGTGPTPTPIDPANPPWGTSGLTVSTSGSDPIQVQVPNSSGGTGTPGTGGSTVKQILSDGQVTDDEWNAMVSSIGQLCGQTAGDGSGEWKNPEVRRLALTFASNVLSLAKKGVTVLSLEDKQSLRNILTDIAHNATADAGKQTGVLYSELVTRFALWESSE